MNIRQIVKFNPNYFEINREERNYAAIFFAALCMNENIDAFLRHCGFIEKVEPEFGIYFEYAYLRDLWFLIEDEFTKKKIICEKLRINGIEEILEMPLKAINQRFGVAGEGSSEYLEYPGKWAVTKFNKNFSDNDDFLKICKFKWSFNIKPDIVINLKKDKAICIEAKYESGEGSYPTSSVEKSIFNDRGLEFVGQMQLQKYMMEDLLGIETDFIFLVFKKAQSETHKVITWAEAFEAINMSGMPEFSLAMANNISKA